MSKRLATIDDWVQRYLRDEVPRAKSMLISAFGDSIAPYADGIWLGALIELMAPLGVNERLVRTSAFRLVEEGWLRARREGRRSYYTLTASGTQRFEAAYSHIYLPPPANWDGQWTQLLMPRNGEDAPERAELRRELEWEGFAQAAPGLLIHPGFPLAELRRAIDRHRLAGQVVVMQARAEAGDTGNAQLARCWNLAEVESRYQAFLSRFSPLSLKLSSVSLAPAQAFQLQTLMIHSFRRANLHDPRLPLSMLAPDWLGLRAYRLCGELYARTRSLTRTHLAALDGFTISDAQGARLRMPVRERFA